MGRLGAALGTPLMPWQQYAANVGLEIDPATGYFRYPLVVVTVPRQAGKTALERALLTHRSLTVPDASCWLTAQTRNDARDTWLQVVRGIQRSPLDRLAMVRRTNGSEAVTFPGSGELRLFAPSEDALHGKTTDLVCVDEGWAFDAEQGATLTQAIVPTQVTRPNGQLWVFSTAGTARSQWLRSLVEAGREAIRAGSDQSSSDVPSPALLEWGIPEDTEDLDDMDVYVRHHPAIGHTIQPSALARARASMDAAARARGASSGAAEYARAYGNFWITSSVFVINPQVWTNAATAEPFAPGSPVAFAAEVYADRSGAVILAAGRLADGTTAVEVVEHRGGVGWLAPRLMELTARHRPCSVVVDPHGPARTVHKELSEARRPVPLAEFGAGDLITAHAAFLDGLTDRTVRQRPDEAGRLSAALNAALTRRVREEEVLSRAMSADGESPAALLAAELAAWGLAHPSDTTPRPILRVAEQ